MRRYLMEEEYGKRCSISHGSWDFRSRIRKCPEMGSQRGANWKKAWNDDAGGIPVFMESYGEEFLDVLSN